MIRTGRLHCAVTASTGFGTQRLLGRTLAQWRQVTLRLLQTVTVNARVDARRLTGLEVHLADGREMARLNFRHLKHRGATDVLTFPLDDPTTAAPGKRSRARGRYRPVAGVVIVCPTVAEREARARELAPTDELLRYILHGVLHLLGEDDKTPAARRRMHAIQERLLDAWLAQSPSPARRPKRPLRAK